MITSMKDILSLNNKTALITGGNRGIGKGISIAMAQSGANVAIMCRDEKTAAATVAEINAYGGTHHSYIADVTDIKQCSKAVDEVIKNYGRVDILVNNSGIARFGAVMDMDEKLEDWYDVINVNLNGPFIMSYLVGKHMKEQGGGSIVNISSNAARIVNKPQLMCSYNSAKAGLDRMTKCLAYEWAQYKIRLNCIAPGYTETDLTYQLPDNIKHYIDHWKSQTPLGRFGLTLEVGAMAVYLASEAAEQVTGAVFTIDGGYMLAL